jgi:hypothetical protein
VVIEQNENGAAGTERWEQPRCPLQRHRLSNASLSQQRVQDQSNKALLRTIAAGSILEATRPERVRSGCAQREAAAAGRFRELREGWEIVERLAPPDYNSTA